MKEQEIITCLQEKTENAAELFLHQYRPLIRYIVKPFLSDEMDVEECINDVAMKICSKIDGFDPEKGSWNAWITAIARNTALNRSRTRKNDVLASFSLDSEDAEQISASDLTPEEALIQKERQQILVDVIRHLSTQEKMIFYRKYYYCQSTLQIASELGLTERSVEGRLYRIRKKIRDRVGGDFHDR